MSFACGIYKDINNVTHCGRFLGPTALSDCVLGIETMYWPVSCTWDFATPTMLDPEFVACNVAACPDLFQGPIPATLSPSPSTTDTTTNVASPTTSITYPPSTTTIPSGFTSSFASSPIPSNWVNTTSSGSVSSSPTTGTTTSDAIRKDRVSYMALGCILLISISFVVNA